MAVTMKPDILGIHFGSFSTLGSLSVISFPIRNAPQGETNVHHPVFCLPYWMSQKLLRESMWNEPLSEVQSSCSSCILLLDFECQRKCHGLLPILSGLICLIHFEPLDVFWLRTFLQQQVVEVYRMLWRKALLKSCFKLDPISFSACSLIYCCRIE